MEGRKVDMFKNLRQILNENATDSYYNINCIKIIIKAVLLIQVTKNLYFSPPLYYLVMAFFLWKRGGDFMNK